MKTRILVVFFALVFAMGNISVSHASDDNDIATITDVTLVRPGCFLATVVGSVFFVVSQVSRKALRSQKVCVSYRG